MSPFQMAIGPELIDEYGHVNYKNFPGLFEPAQDAFMAERGCSFDAIERHWALRSFVGKLVVSYKGQVFAGQTIRISTTVKPGMTSATYHQIMEGPDGIVAELELLVVFVGVSGKATPIPQELREILSEEQHMEVSDV